MTRLRGETRVAAELGRPETPEETAARLAENSRSYRSRKTMNNLVLSLLATLLAVFVLVLLVPRSDSVIERNVDYRSVASQAQAGVEESLASPELPAGWHANAAEWRSGPNDRVPSWYIGVLTPENEFIGLTQAFGADPTWLSDQLQQSPAADTVSIADVQWDVYHNTAPREDRGNFDYALATAAGTSTYLLVGTADESEFVALARALAANIHTNGTR